MTPLHPPVHAACPWLCGVGDGGVAPWPPFGHRSIAVDPTATRANCGNAE
jgi:hypothetical protein